jgi:hypothetical protein
VQLGRIASPPTINGISTCEDLKAATILASVATHLPHVKTFRCGRSHTAARISQVRFESCSLFRLNSVT